MPAVTRVGDNNTGHDACPPTALSRFQLLSSLTYN